MRRRHYSDFADKLDLDAFEAAIGFEPSSQERGEDIGHCLFPEMHKHGDTTGKFAINREKKVWNCFVCGGGDLLSLAMLHTGLDYEQATDWLHVFATSDARSDQEWADNLIAMLDDAHDRVDTIPYFHPRVLDQFDGPTDYFLGRGISQEVVDTYGLRYTETAHRSAPVTMVDGRRTKMFEDYEGPASIWPHYWNGKLTGWQYRWTNFGTELMPSGWKIPKWTNTTDFPRSTTLFNYNDALKSNTSCVVVESLGTCLFLRSYGIPAVAYFGSKPTEIQLRLLRRFTNGVILAPDNDSNAAGDKILETVDYLERFVPVYIADKVEGDDGADLGDYAKTDDPYGNLMIHLEHRVHQAGLSI
jgi:hypothetical protein